MRHELGRRLPPPGLVVLRRPLPPGLGRPRRHTGLREAARGRLLRLQLDDAGLQLGDALDGRRELLSELPIFRDQRGLDLVADPAPSLTHRSEHLP